MPSGRSGDAFNRETRKNSRNASAQGWTNPHGLMTPSLWHLGNEKGI